MILYTQSFIVRVQQKPAKKFTCVKVRTEQNPKLFFGVWQKILTKLYSRRCLPMLCLHWIQSMRGFRFCNKSLYWPGPKNAGAKNFVAVVHSAHISRRTSAHARKKNFWNPGTGRRHMGSRTHNGLRRCVSRRFWLFAWICVFEAFPCVFHAFSVDAFNPKRIGRAQ